MSPEQKKSEIVWKITEALMENNATLTKQAILACAIVCVEEILSANLSGGHEENFWQQVKQSLIK